MHSSHDLRHKKKSPVYSVEVLLEFYFMAFGQIASEDILCRIHTFLCTCGATKTALWSERPNGGKASGSACAS